MISEKIVVVDDEPRVVTSIKLSLEEYEIIDFPDGDTALEFLRMPNTIQLVILDVMMPGIDGISVLREIKKIREDIAVIIMTAYGSKDVVLQALRSRADDFIEKPFNVDDLRTKIHGILRTKANFSRQANDREDAVERIKRFIERNYKNVSLERVAEELCLSPKYVSRLFNEQSKMSFRSYILAVKIEKARALLTQTSLPVADISLKLGYQNAESFMRVFKRETSVTPTEYRTMKKKG